MPAKRFLLQLDPNFIAFRKKQLEEFLMKLTAEPLYFSDSSFHLFLQSDLSVDTIDDYLAGNVSQAVVDRAIEEMAQKTVDIQAATANPMDEVSSETHSERDADYNNVTEAVGDSERERTGVNKGQSFSTANTVTSNTKPDHKKNSKSIQTVEPDPTLKYTIN